MDSVATVEEAAEKLIEGAGIDSDEAFKLVMGIREAAVNAVLHGNGYDPARQMTVTMECSQERVMVTVADEGPGFDLGSLPDPRAEENLMRGTGRGIFLIRSFFDEVNFRQLHPGTEIQLVKKFAASTGASG